MGRPGVAVVLVLPNEATYGDFLRVRKVPCGEIEKGAARPELNAMMKSWVLEDRDLIDKVLKSLMVECHSLRVFNKVVQGASSLFYICSSRPRYGICGS